MLVGAAIGFFTGGAGYIALGAALGGMVGSAIDPPKGPDIIGPRLDDLSFQTSTYGAPLARAYGTVAVTGNVFWLENDQLKETTTTEEQGGKGGSSSETTTYTYSATFAVGLLHVPDGAVVSLRRLWIDTDLVFDAGSDNTESIIASNQGAVDFTFYPGSDDQLPNPRMQADKGAANVSAYPGMCYIVFEDLSLEKYSNTLMRAQVKAELVIGQSTVSFVDVGTLQDTFDGTGATESAMLSSAVIDPSGVSYGLGRFNQWTGHGDGGYARRFQFGEYDSMIMTTDHALGITSGQLNSVAICSQCAPGTLPVFLQSVYPLGGETWFSRIEGSTITVTNRLSNSEWTYGRYVRIAAYETGFYMASPSHSHKILRVDGIEISVQSTVSVRATAIGYSENYLFVVDGDASSGSSCTVKRFDRASLSLDATYAQSVPGSFGSGGLPLLHILSDDEFYLCVGSNCSYWVGGVAENLGTVFDYTNMAINTGGWFRVLNHQPFSALLLKNRSPENTPAIVRMTYNHVDAETASLRNIVTSECALAGVDSGDIDLNALTDHAVRGYKIAARSSVRAALEPLQAAFPFDVAASGYKLRFVSRGGASVATIPSEDLGATDGDNLPVLLPVSREMESQLPYRVNVRYSDAGREYDVGEQYAERPAESLSERTVELAIVLTADEAAQKADVLLEKEWVERTDIGPFTFPPTWAELEAADVVTIEHRNQQHEARLTRVEYLPDGRLQCQAKLTQAASYVSTAQGSDPLVVGQSLVPLKGSTAGYLLDIPRIRSEQDVPGMAYALTGLASGWPGGVMLRSDDSGASYQVIGSTNTRARVFTAGASIGAHHGYSIDHGSELTVTPRYSAHTLSSVTEEQLYSQANLAAYGADGRWEIVSFKTVTDNTGSYTLKDFLRGLYGTEWATGLHDSGDYLVMLDTTTVGFFGLPTNAIGSERIYRAITQGASIDSAASEADIYEANNLKPLSPVDISGSRDSVSLDWTISAERRTRWPVEVFSGAAVPLGESSEAYEFEIWDSSYSTLKRTLSGTSSSVSYTLAQQTADFGGEQGVIYIKVYQLSDTVGKGFSSIYSMSRNVVDDPYLGSVVLLMHMNDTALTDQKLHAVSIFGNAARSATQSKFGGYSCYFDGSGDYLTLADSGDWYFANQNFTCEAWFYETSAAASRQIIGQHTTQLTSNSNFLILSNSQKVEASVFYGSTILTISNPSTHTLNAWHHVALVREGANLSLYLDGSRVATSATIGSNNLNNSTKSLSLGVVFNNSGPDPANLYFTGYIDEVRITKAARYSGTTYSVPTSAFPNP